MRANLLSPALSKPEQRQNIGPCRKSWTGYHGCSCWKGRRLAGELAVNLARPSGVGQARSSCSPGAPSSLAMLLNSVSASGNHGHACSSAYSACESTKDIVQFRAIQARRSSEAHHCLYICTTAQKSCATNYYASLHNQYEGMRMACMDIAWQHAEHLQVHKVLIICAQSSIMLGKPAWRVSGLT